MRPIGLRLRLEGGALRRWSLLGAVSILDQGILSGSNFLVNILLARWLPAEEYGAFAVAFALFLFLSGFHNAVILEPTSVLGPARYPDRLWGYFRSMVFIHILLSGTAGMALAGVAGLLFGSPGVSTGLGPAFMGAGLATPFILFLWLARRFAYVLRRPWLSLAGSLASLTISVGVLAVVGASGAISPLGAFGIMAASSLAGGIVVLVGTARAARAEDSDAPGPPVRTVLSESWHYGRWLAGASTLALASGQLQTIAAAFVGLEAAAGLRAAQNFALPMAQSVTAVATLGLPALSADYGKGERATMVRKGKLITFGLTSLAALYALTLFLVRGPLERLIYGGKYASYSGIIALMLTLPVLAAASSGYSLILRAGQWPEHYLIATAVSAGVGLTTGLVFPFLWGVWGAALSVCLSHLAGALAAFRLFRVWEAREVLRVESPVRA